MRGEKEGERKGERREEGRKKGGRERERGKSEGCRCTLRCAELHDEGSERGKGTGAEREKTPMTVVRLCFRLC